MDKQELIALCKAGDKEALSTLYETYAEKMKDVCLSYTHNKYIADDILHDGFIIIITSINQLKNPDKLEYWMITIMKNLCLKYLNNKKDTIPLPDIKENDEPANSSIIIHSDYQKILESIERLPEGYRTVFKYAIFDGLTHKEIGEKLGINEKSSSSQLARAKAILRKFIIKEGLLVIIIGLPLIPEKLDKAIIFLHKSFIADSNKSRLQNNRQRTTMLLISSEKPLKESHKDSVQTDTVQVQAKSLVCQVDTSKHSKVYIKTDRVPQYDSTYPVNSFISASKNQKKWSLSLSYYTGNRFDNKRTFSIPGSIISGEDETLITEKVTYHIPFAISLSLHRHINARWSIATGVQYTRLRIDTIRSDKSNIKTQTENYINIPLKVLYKFIDNERFTCYTSSGITINVPINGHHSLHSSITTGIGLQYNITKNLGLFIEPNVNYHLKRNNFSLMGKNHSLEVTIPIGISYSW